MQQLALRGLEVRQQAYLFENLLRQGVRLVDDHHSADIGAKLLQQVGLQRSSAGSDRGFGRQAELGEEMEVQVGARQRRIENQGGAGAVAKLFEQGVEERRLAGADLTGQHREAAPVAYSVK